MYYGIVCTDVNASHDPHHAMPRVRVFLYDNAHDAAMYGLLASCSGKHTKLDPQDIIICPTVIEEPNYADSNNQEASTKGSTP